ncbi:MAG TPA: phosphatase PAP2 family protein [Acidimicrobiales bacterium]|nr:phosphatase PAP2 family protein [Acidimicrobiales bacterium]
MALLSRHARQGVADFDEWADAALDHLRGHPMADRIFYGASAVFDHSVGWLILGALRGLRSEHEWTAAVRVGAGVFVESGLVNFGIKSLFRRSRPPWEVDRPLPLRRPRTSSFPSGHATAAFTAAALLADDDPLWPLYYALAVVVSTSRAYVRIHHPSDVLGGIAVGIVLGRVGRRLFPLPPRPSRLLGGDGRPT